MKKLLAFALILVTVMPLLISCNGKSDETTPQITDASGKIELWRTGEKTDYTIVYPNGANAELVTAIDNLVKRIKGFYGGIEITAAMEAQSTDSDKEILIGATSRSESVAAAASITDPCAMYIKLHDNGTLVITGKNDEATLAAVKYFSTKHLENVADSFALEKSFEESTVNYDITRSGWLLRDVPSYWGGVLSKAVYNIGPDALMSVDVSAGSMQVVSDTDSAEYSEYVDRLIKAGYTKVSENIIGKNMSSQYRTKKSLVNIFYNDATKRTHIIKDTASISEAEFEFNCTDGDAAFYQYALMYDPRGQGGPTSALKPYDNAGMLDIIKLSDNSVILIDGGDTPQVTPTSVRGLLNFLHTITETKDGEKIRVAAIYFTHAHGDHKQFVEYLISNHYSELEVERLMHNLYREGGNSGFAAIGKKLAENYPNMKFLKLHTGQRVRLGNAEFEVLYTHEDMVNANTADYKFADFNNTSTVVKLYLNGRSFMLLGDLGGTHTYDEDEAQQTEYKKIQKWLFDTYNPSEHLKSDVLQVAHHAINTWMGNLYAEIEATYAFSPCQDREYNSYTIHGYYKQVIDQLRSSGIKDSNIFFGGQFTYGLKVTSTGSMSIQYRPIETDSKYSVPDMFHAPNGTKI